LASVNEQNADQGKGAKIAQFEFIYDEDLSEIDPDRTYDQTAGTNGWEFYFHGIDDTLATYRVRHNTNAKAANDTGKTTLRVFMDLAQTRRTMEALARNAGRFQFDIPDGQSRYKDTTENGYNTVTVTPPKSNPFLSSGKYVVTEWSGEWLSDDFFVFNITLGETA
jgi:hypothetical protein